MRSRSTNIRGEIALIEKGTGTVVGTAQLIDVLPPFQTQQMALQFDKHRISNELIHSPGFKWFTPWVLAGVRRLPLPIRYAHPSGAVTWVNLSDEETAAVRGSNAGSCERPSLSAGSVTSEDSVMAYRAVSQISDRAGLNIPSDASTSVRRSGNKLYIDVQWDDGLPPRRSWKRPEWLDAIGMFGVATSAFCCLGLMLHLPLAVLSSSFTILGALKWVPAIFVAMLVAVIGGHGDDLEEIFGRR
jgi:hypothetical protein